MVTDPSFWMFLAFVALLGLTGKKSWISLTQKLDARAENIVRDIEEAQLLKEEAQQLLNHAMRLQRDMNERIEEIMIRTKKEITHLKKEAALEIDQHLKSEEYQLNERIQLSIQQALKEIEEKAIQVALHASKNVMTIHANEQLEHVLFQKAIDKLSQASIAG